MKNWKKICAAVVLAGAFCMPGMADAAGNGYVNYQTVIESMPAFSNAQKELTSAQQDLQKQFNDQSKNMNDQQKQALADRLNNQLRTRVDNIQKNEIIPAVNKIRVAIEAAAKKNDVDFVVQESAWLYGGKDLTQDVVSALK